MKKILIASLVFGAAALPFCANAQSMEKHHSYHNYKEDYKQEVVPPAPLCTWTGFYLGLNAGGKWASFNAPVTIGSSTLFGVTLPATTVGFNSNPSSFVGGLQAGYDYQWDAYVFGVEGDWDWMSLSANRTVGPNFTGDNFVSGDSFNVRSTWEASVRGRLGYAMDSWLLYLTGGASFLNVKTGANFIPVTSGSVRFPGASASTTKTLTGWTVGAGTEYQYTNNWSFALEYRYASYGNQNFGLGSVAEFHVSGPSFVFAPASLQSQSLHK